MDFARALNDFGQVTGELYTPTGTDTFKIHAFITGPNGVGIKDLGTFLGAVATSGATINNAGQVAGVTWYPDGYLLDAFITGPNGVDPKMLIAPGGRTYPAGINEAGQVVGTTGGKYSQSAFIAGPNDGYRTRDIGELGGKNPNFLSGTYASGINETGQVAGHSYAVGEPGVADVLHAFITDSNGMGMRDIGTLGGAVSYGGGINDAGQVAGTSTTADGSEHAFITGPNGVRMRDLGTLGGVESRALDINDVGQVVGSFSLAEGESRAFITGPNGEGMTDFNSLLDLPHGVILTHADYDDFRTRNLCLDACRIELDRVYGAS